MTVLNYMTEVKNRLRAKHEGETFLFGGEFDCVPVVTRSAEEILDEMSRLQGLNKFKRRAVRQRVKECVTCN